jgi:hypothetical protein
LLFHHCETSKLIKSLFYFIIFIPFCVHDIAIMRMKIFMPWKLICQNSSWKCMEKRTCALSLFLLVYFVRKKIEKKVSCVFTTSCANFIYRFWNKLFTACLLAVPFLLPTEWQWKCSHDVENYTKKPVRRSFKILNLTPTNEIMDLLLPMLLCK